MKALFLTNHFQSADKIALPVVEMPKPTLLPGYSLVKVNASGINASDALGTLGYFNHAQLPRIPGRDFAGVIVEGDAAHIGKRVWGSGGAAGIDFNGTHAEYLQISNNAIAEIPANLDPLTAGAQPLPYITAYYGLVTRAHLKAGESVLVMGALGQVGFAAMSICRWQHCNPIAVVRGNEDLQNALKLNWQVVDSNSTDFAQQILSVTQGKKIDVILNSLGNIYWNDYKKVLNPFGRIITIGAREATRDVNINLFELYRANQDLINVNTVALDYIANAQLLNQMRPGFETGVLQPLQTDASAIFPLEKASIGYQKVLAGSEGKRIMLSLQ